MMRLWKLRRLVVLAMLSCSACLADERELGRNLVSNGAFEAVENGGPQGWAAHTWGGSGRFTRVAGGRGGGHCLLIESEDGGDLSWETFVPVTPRTTYRMAGWIKTENLVPSSGRGALLNVHGHVAGRTGFVAGTRDWTRMEAYVYSGAREQMHVNCLFGGWGVATGRAWFDDISLQEIAVEDALPSVTIEAERVGEPISEYVYGQFIEHLGRCIYGGIWAEMLDDRKFFFPVGDASSPWKSIGGRDAIAMERAGSFVGEQTPLIRRPDETTPERGIVQRGLGLRAGQMYVGHVWLRAAAEPCAVDVSLVWGTGRGDRRIVRIKQVPQQYTRFPLHFPIAGDADSGQFEIVVRAGGGCYVGTASLMPADNVHGLRADTLRVLTELNAPIYRWPGGNFVSGYDWRDGIGDRDRRPPRKNPAWQGIEPNDFGLDEFIRFCRAVGAEPLVVVNTGFGDAHSAAQEVEYANGDASTPMGAWRAASGRTEPYGVVWWGVGNEMYGGWQLGHMKLEHYVLKHNQVVEKMRQVDPTIKTIAVGNLGEWSQGMLQGSPQHMDLISEHFYCGEQTDVVEHVAQIPAAVRAKAEGHRRYRESLSELAGKDIRIALDEWNYWYGPHIYGELGTRYFLKDALGIAAGLHEIFRSTDTIAMAQYAQTVNVIGCVKTTKTDAAFATTGLVLQLYRQRFGEHPVAVDGDWAAFNLDVAAAWTADRTALTIGVVNPHERPFELVLNVTGATLSEAGRLWLLTGDDPRSYNMPGHPPRVAIKESPVASAEKLVVPPFSVSLFLLPAQPESAGAPAPPSANRD
ncbi:MAG: alpha-N-arabinofuranosidase [Planctomycetes bacterium]|nr:alpha-N-arabinofuranosidase [Planctomycetota bacterium]